MQGPGDRTHVQAGVRKRHRHGERDDERREGPPPRFLCHDCRQGRYQVRGLHSYACPSCGSRATGAAFPVDDDEQLIVLAGVLQVLTVPHGHQVISPTRRCHAPHVGASLALALRLDRTPHRVPARPKPPRPPKAC
ncbi:hypothetical protein [Streptomyces mirabilis]|uniref:hypothetical protein n=1 Tax=Streptomyces mirabilis TaxID=68239 RepID=UPI0038301CD8